jgi:hypothetical protein
VKKPARGDLARAVTREPQYYNRNPFLFAAAENWVEVYPSHAVTAGTSANMHRPELVALPTAIATVCARRKLKPIGSETFGETIRADVRAEVYAAVDSKTKEKLRRKPKWPGARTIARTIDIPVKNVGTDADIP